MPSVRDQLSALAEWASSLEALSEDAIRTHFSEIKGKFRNMVTFKSEVDLLGNDEVSAQCEQLLYRVRQLRDRARGIKTPKVPALVDTVYVSWFLVFSCKFLTVHFNNASYISQI